MKSASQVVVVPLRSRRLRLWTIRSDHTIWSSCECKPRYFKPWEPDTDCWNPARPPFAAEWAAAAALPDSSVRFWGTDVNGEIWSCCETGMDPADPWTVWAKDWARSAPPFKAEQITVAPLSDKRLQFWAVDRGGAIWSCWMSDTSPTSDWTKWTNKWTPRRPSFRTTTTASAPLADGRLQFWAVDDEGGIWSCSKSSTESTARWTPWAKDWAPIPPFRTETVAVCPLADKRLRLWAIDEDGEIWSTLQPTRGASSWSAWTKDWAPVPPPFRAKMIAVAPLIDKRPQIWVVDMNGEVWSCWQTADDAWTIFGLFFTMQAQEQAMWCWAATATSLSHFYDPASPWKQCDVVNRILSSTTCCQNGNSTGCNQPTFLKPVLDLTANFAGSAGGAASEETLLSELKAGRPVAVRMYSPSRGGHFIVVCGCGAGTVMVKDPWDGPTCVPYDAFRDQYMGTHSWHTTFFTKP